MAWNDTFELLISFLYCFCSIFKRFNKPCHCLSWLLFVFACTCANVRSRFFHFFFQPPPFLGDQCVFRKSSWALWWNQLRTFENVTRCYHCVHFNNWAMFLFHLQLTAAVSLNGTTIISMRCWRSNLDKSPFIGTHQRTDLVCRCRITSAIWQIRTRLVDAREKESG